MPRRSMPGGEEPPTRPTRPSPTALAMVVAFGQAGGDVMAKQHRRRGWVFAGAVKRRTLCGFAGAVLIAALASTAVRARDDYPARPVQMIIPFAAGGPTDIVGRVMGAKMGEGLGQQFIVENKNGAGGNIGAEAVAQAAPDGYTIFMSAVSTHAIHPRLYKHITYYAAA